ncbi:MAG: helix-turn-helix transcriptional regulator [Clostridia bacterium]|nr:helix-turn-helix transcriptional regulator [Clostridia bacterium]
MSTIGQRISELRKNNSYSQEYVAEKLSVSRQAVSKWEQDLSAPDTYNLIALAELFDVSVEFIATGKIRESATPPEPPKSPVPHRSGITVRQILGLILVAVGLLAGILGVLIESLLIIMAVFVTVVGILCITVKKHFGMYLAWTLLIMTFPIIFMIMPVTPHSGAASGISISIGGIFFILFIGLLVITLAVSIIKLIRSKK